MTITVTESAERYLAELLEKQNVEGIAVRLFVTQPGTAYAETCLAYCRPDEVNAEDEVMDMELLRFYMERNSLPYLDEAHIDFAEDRMGGQLTIKAPNAKVPKVSPDSPMDEQINYILYSEVNPGLASHGGEVKLTELVEEEAGMIAILRFGGGCQGCSAVDMTLKDGVEKTLIERVPGLAGVRDVTDHSVRENAYFK
ncbi:MAG: Fe-S biogenesis protein NfuA [Oceanospirillales bacterium]|uniref:Fe/S biogenesis protein NfuA n=1 Tax=Marinobacterium halophilum TaxID=267374 RepID=A0A2P8F0J9_9GAMM|nr:Fe-S biogenesis protein NfuA [Marinobacterium halophilum]MBR9827373.1 Fe-S biogenesis protein NfuA [Oceanospirillales bacterium]PSL15249.1 Fe/S biogenesis protein NfuA [Marinobacterium halophilum]